MMMNQAIIHRQYVIYCYKSNIVGFIQKCCYSLIKSRMTIFGHTSWPYSSHFGPIELKIFMETQKTITYQLMIQIQNPSYFPFLIFQATFSGELGVASTRAPSGPGPPDQTLMLALWVDLLGQPLSESRNHVFEISRPEPPRRCL